MMPDWIDFVTALSDSFVENGCIEDAINLKWQRVTLIQKGCLE